MKLSKIYARTIDFFTRSSTSSGWRTTHLETGHFWGPWHFEDHTKTTDHTSCCWEPSYPIKIFKPQDCTEGLLWKSHARRISHLLQFAKFRYSTTFTQVCTVCPTDFGTTLTSNTSGWNQSFRAHIGTLWPMQNEKLATYTNFFFKNIRD